VRARFLPLILIAGTMRSMPAQWHVGLELATMTYRGSSSDSSGSHVISGGGPGGGLALGLSVGHAWHRMAGTVRVSYANPGFAVHGNDMSIIDKTTGTLIEAALPVGTRVGGIGPSGAIWVELGPSLHLWDFDGRTRTRAGALGAVSYQWPISSRFAGAIRLEGLISPSWFNAADLPPEFERQATWRYGWGVGLRYRLS